MKCPNCNKVILPGHNFCQWCGSEASQTSNPTTVPVYPPQLKSTGVNPDARCPTCGLNRIQRFSPGNKVVKIAALGVFGLGDVHKIFKCLNCGYKW